MRGIIPPAPHTLPWCGAKVSTWTVLLLQYSYCEIMRNANLMQQGNFIDVFLARHISGTYAHHQEH